MKRTLTFLSVLLMIAVIWWRLSSLTPIPEEDHDLPLSEFSISHALDHVKTLSEAPHFVGSENHTKVRNYIMGQLSHLGLSPRIQEGLTTGKGNYLSRVNNIYTTIKGDREGPALLLMTHYDSHPHSALGASDAGSGVAVILEAIRAHLESGPYTGNDLILLFTDGEELGLNGARYFVENIPVPQEIGLVLNFEARGSGGPGIMLLETNGGNEALINSFAEARVSNPFGSSLFYSIYKLLPNDTDLTIFRETGNIPGFNFAFIDDHFDYHTAMDSFERLDRPTLAHQAGYLMPLLKYYSQADLNTLSSNKDLVYFDLPGGTLFRYPFSAILSLWMATLLLFLLVLAYGIKTKRLPGREVLHGTAKFIFILVFTVASTYLGWELILLFYPHYTDILHGFPYGGYWYMAAGIALVIAVCLLVYHGKSKEEQAAYMVAPLFFWLLLTLGISFYLKGASYLVFPVALSIICWAVMLRQKHPNAILMLLLLLPALWLITPLIRMFPVALGLKSLPLAAVLTTLTFGLSLPVTGYLKRKQQWGYFFLIITGISLWYAHRMSPVTPDHPHHTSLVYMEDAKENNAFLATYNNSLSSWLSTSLGNDPKPYTFPTEFGSKYGTPFTFYRSVTPKKIIPPQIRVLQDSIIKGERSVKISVLHLRQVSRLEVFLNNGELLSGTVNGEPLTVYSPTQDTQHLFTHYITNNDPALLELKLKTGSGTELIFYESSNDLLTHPAMDITPRPRAEIPMPFVLNDAVITRSVISL